jgi:aspartyl-tRNA(Asn)/glutamyl-tRNA(Gln) amidotransferase subunit A
MAVPAYTKELQLTGVKKIGYIKDCLENPGLDNEIKSRVEEVIEDLRLQGHEVVPVDFPYIEYLVPAYYVLTTAEASSNLARYDGIHYGYRSDKTDDWESVYFKSRSEGFGKEVKRRIMLGTYVLSAGYFDAYYAKAQKVRRIFRDKTNEILNNHDFILLPTTPNTAPKLGENMKDPIAMYLEDIFTVQAPLTGLPAISLPIGEHTNGMPFGIQLMGSRFSENALFAFSNELMQNFGDN